MKTHSTLLAIVVAGMACLLASCGHPDPLYFQNARYIKDCEYPKNRIVGSWATLQTPVVSSDRVHIEDKSYFQLRSGGTGQVRQFSKNYRSGSTIELEANLHWSYLGRNHWRISLPSSDAYRVTNVTGGMSKGYRGPVNHVVRYYDGRLYEPQRARVWVPLTEREIKALAERMRSQGFITVERR